MKVVGGLTLKREVAPSAHISHSSGSYLASIWVDSGIYHLDEPYTYLIPDHLNGVVQIGSLVSIPFNGRELVGAVIEIFPKGEESGYKTISKVLGTIPPLTPQIINLVQELSKRYAAHPFDFLRSALVDRVASVESEFTLQRTKVGSSRLAPVREFLQLPPHRDPLELLAEHVKKIQSSGGTLVVVPELRDLHRLADILEYAGISFAFLDSSLARSERYRSFLSIRTGLAEVVIGTRSAIFAPLNNLTSILILNELSENHYERRTPGWNVREVALLRSRLEKVNLFLYGFSPSADVARLIELKWISYRKVRAKIRGQVISSQNGELLPSRALSIIRKSLSKGPVLFLVPLKGYAQAIRCAGCKTLSLCACGGVHQLTSAKSPISCSHCGAKIERWICAWCHSEKSALNSRGADRHLHELAALLPGYSGALSTSDHPLADAPKSGFVVATPNMAPRAIDGYATVVILEGNRFLSQPDMRAHERVREMYFSHSAQVRREGEVIIVQDGGEALVNSLLTWNPVPAIHRELEERNSLHLPPYVRSAKLTLPTPETMRLKKALETALDEGRLPDSTRILGPIEKGEESSLIITVNLASGEELLSSLHQFLKRRSASKKPLPRLRIDPYSLSI